MKILKAFLCVVGITLLTFSCGKEAYDFGSGEGDVNFQLTTDYSTSIVGTKAEESPQLNVDDFTMEIFNSAGVKFKKWKYGEIKEEKVRMNKGIFTAHAFYGDSTATGFDAHYYAGKQVFTVEGQSTTEVSVVCKMANVKIAVQWGENLVKDYSDYSVKVYREGRNGSLLFNKGEERCGYIPAGDLKLEISLTDPDGNKRVYSPKAISSAANDFITFTIDTKEAAKEEVSVSFQLVTGTDDKTETVVIPAALVAKPAPTVEMVGFTDGVVSFVEGTGIMEDLQLRITAPGFIEKCELVTKSEFFPSNWPSNVDLLSASQDVLSMIRAYGISWSMSRGMDKYGIIDFKELSKKIRVIGNNENEFKVIITDVKGQKAEVDLVFNITEASVSLNEIPDYDMWANKVYVELTTNVDDISLLKFESLNSDASSVLSTISSSLVSRIGNVSRFELTGLTPGTSYLLRANYCNGFKYTSEKSCVTEVAQQLENGDMEKWSNNSYTTYGQQGKIYLYYPGASSSDKVWCTKNPLTMHGVGDGTSSGTTNQRTAYRWNSCTIPTTDAVSGNAAEIRTMGLSTVGLGGTDVGSGFLWSTKAVEDAVKKNYRVYAGVLYTGSTDVASGVETINQTGIGHSSRPQSLKFNYKYAPYNGDKCKIKAILYNASGEVIASTDEFESSLSVANYNELTLDFNYSSLTSKAAKLFVIFQSGVNEGVNERWEYVTAVDGSYDANPWSLDTFVGSVLKVDNITLNY